MGTTRPVNTGAKSDQRDINKTPAFYKYICIYTLYTFCFAH